MRRRLGKLFSDRPARGQAALRQLSLDVRDQFFIGQSNRNLIGPILAVERCQPPRHGFGLLRRSIHPLNLLVGQRQFRLGPF